MFQLLNFILGQVKLAIYMSRKSKLEQWCNDDVVMAFRSLLKARILIDFSYYNVMNRAGRYGQNLYHNIFKNFGRYDIIPISI